MPSLARKKLPAGRLRRVFAGAFVFTLRVIDLGMKMSKCRFQEQEGPDSDLESKTPMFMFLSPSCKLCCENRVGQNLHWGYTEAASDGIE